MAGASDLYLLGIGYRHVKGGEDQFAQASAKVKSSAKEAAEGTNLAENAMDSFKDSMRDVVAEAIGLVAAYVSIHAAIDAVLEGVKQFAELDEQMSRLRALTDANAGAMSLFSQEARNIGASTIFGATDAAAAMTTLSKAGETARETIASMPDAEHLAIIAHTNLAEAADDAALSLHRFNLPASETGTIVDHMATIVQRSRADVGDLVDVMKQAGPAAGAMGLHFDEAGAALGVLSQKGGNARQQGSALLQVLAVLSNPTQQVARDLKILGLTLDDLDPKTHSLTQILEALRQKNLDAGSAFALFGHQGGGAILSLTQLIPQLLQMEDALKHDTGAGERLAEVMEDNLKSSGERLSRAMDALKLSIGAGLAPAVRDVSEDLAALFRNNRGGAERFGEALGTALRGVVDIFVVLVEHGREVVAVLVAVGVGFAAIQLGPLIIATYQYAAAFAALAASEGFAAVATLELSLAWGRFTAMLAANPVGVIAVALGALALVLYEIISRTRDAAQAQAAYTQELVTGKPVIEGVTRAHDALVAKLREEVALRDELSKKAAENKDRLAQLQPILAAAEKALGAGDTAGYKAAIDAAQKLGVAIEAGGQKTGLEQFREQVHALALESDAATRRMTANNDMLAANQESLRDRVVQAVQDEVHSRLETDARIAESDAAVARARQHLADLMAHSFGDNSMAVMVQQAADALKQLEQNAKDARTGMDELDARVKALRNDALLKATELMQAGKFEDANSLLRGVGVSNPEIDRATEQMKAYNATLAARKKAEDDARKAVEDALAKERERLRLIQDLLIAYNQLTGKLTASIAGYRSEIAAYGMDIEAGDRRKQQVDDLVKADEAASKFRGKFADDLADKVKNLTLQELQESRAATIAHDLASQRLGITAALAAGLAKLADTQAGNSLASTKAATAAEAETFQHQHLLTTTDKRMVQLRQWLQLRDKELYAYDQEAQKVQRDLQFKVDQRTAEAALSDAVDHSTEASRNLAVQLEIEQRIKAAGAELDAKKQADIAAEVIGRHAVTDSLADQAAHAKTLFDSYNILAQAQARFADSQQFRNAVRAYGQDVADILQKYNLLSDATKKQAIFEQAWAIFASEHNTRTLAQITAELEGRQKVLDMEAKGAAKIEIAQAEADKLRNVWIGAFAAMSEALGGTSTQLGRIAGDVGNVITALGKLKDSGKAWSADWTVAMAGAIAAVGALIKELNVGGSNKTGGAQALGGKLDGNYAGVGALVGTIIGGIVGAIVTWAAGGTGAGAGAAIGGALGTVLGAMISKAGDSASASLTASGNVIVGETSNQLNGAVKDALTNIFKGLQTAMASLGLQLQGLPLIDIKVRDNIVRVVVGGIVRTFSSMQDAISFGIAEALKQSALKGGTGNLPPEVIAALKNTTATDLQALQSDIDFAKGIAYYGVPQVVQAIDKTISDFYVAMQRAASLGIDTQKVVAQFIAQIQAQKDQILGIDRTLSPADQMRKDEAAFNQRVLLLRAQAQLDLANMQIQRAELQEKIALYQGNARVVRAGLELDVAAQQGQINLLQTYETALKALDVSIAQTQALLDGLVTISDQELADALARLGRGGQGGGDNGRADFLHQLAVTARTGLPDAVKAVLDLQDQLAELTKKAKELHLTEAQLAAARQALIDAEKKAILDPVRQWLPESKGGTFGMSDWQKQQADLEKVFDDARAANQKLIAATGQRAIADAALVAAEKRALTALAETAIASLGLPMEQTRAKMKTLGDTVSFLKDMATKGAISTDRLNDVLKQLGDQAATELLGMFADLLEQMGRFDDADKLRRAQDELNFQLQRLQLNFLFDQYVALGLISGDLQVRLQGFLDIINDPANWPDFTKPAPTRGTGGNNTAGGAGGAMYGSGAAGAATTDDASRRKAVQDQIDQWNKLGQPAATSGLRDLNDTLVSMSADAQRLGVSLSELQSAYGKAVEDFWDKQLSQYETGGSGANVIDQVAAINKTFDDMIAAAQQYGGDQARIEADRRKAVEDFWDQALQPIKDLEQQMAGGSLGGVSPEQALAAAQERFNDLAARAMSGDASAIQGLPAAVQDLLNQQKAFSGTGPAYQALVATIQQVLAQVLALGGAAVPAGAPPANVVAGLPVPNPFPSLVPSPIPAPAPVPPPTGAPTPRPVPVEDERMGQIVGALRNDAQGRQDDRKALADLRAEVDRLVARGREQDDRIDALVGVVTRLTGFIESQERRAAQGVRK